MDYMNHKLSCTVSHKMSRLNNRRAIHVLADLGQVLSERNVCHCHSQSLTYLIGSPKS